MNRQRVHLPDRTRRSASVRRLAVARIRDQAKSAVVSSIAPGVLVSITPRRVAAATSKLLYPTATFETIFRRGTPASSFSEMTSVMSVIAASLSFIFRSSCAGLTGASFWLLSTSNRAARASSASCEIR